MDQQTQSLWRATSALPRFETLSRDLHVDVAVIGAGITGMTAALLGCDVALNIPQRESRPSP